MKQYLYSLNKLPFHEILFYVFLFLIPIQTRILFQASGSYVDWYFNYHQAIFLYLSDIVLITCFITWVSFYSLKPKEVRLPWILGTIGLWAIFGLFHVKQLNIGLYQVFKGLEVLFIIYYVSQTYSGTKFHISAGIVYISAIFQGLLAIGQFHVQHMLGFRWLGEYIAPIGTSGLATFDSSAGKVIRAYGTMPHPNILGAFLVLGLVLGLYLVSSTSIKHKHWLGLGNILIIIGIFLTFSRLAWLSAGIIVLIYAWHWFHMKQYTNIKWLVWMGIVSCATILFFYSPYIKDRVSESTRNSVSYVDRGVFNQMGLGILKKYPIWGTGTGNYVVEQQTQYPDLEAWQYQPPHNLFIYVAAEQGMMGLVIFVSLLIYIGVSGFRSVPSELKFSILTAALVFLMLGQFDHYFATIQQGRLMLGLVLGMLSALPNIQHEMINNQLPISNKISNDKNSN